MSNVAEAVDLSIFAMPRGDGTVAMEFAIEGVACGGCIGRIEKAVHNLPGIVDARLNFTSRRLSVSWAANSISPAAIVEALRRLGYGAYPFAPRAVEEGEA